MTVQTQAVRPAERHYRYDTERDVHEGDWLIQTNATTECGERWWLVLSARLVRHRVQLPPGQRRWSVTCVERETPTSAAPYLPDDFPTEREQIHFITFYRRHPRRRWRQV